MCKRDELQLLMQFIDTKWKKGHILGNFEEMMLWQHGDPDGETVNFAVAIDTEIQTIYAVLGCIPLWQYDPLLQPSNDLWLSLWKADTADAPVQNIGMRLLEFLEGHFKPATLGVTGIKKRVRVLFEWLGYTTGIMTQYIFVNRMVTSFAIADVPERNMGATADGNCVLTELGSLDGVEVAVPDCRPAKSVTYLVNRYAKHPLYKYRFFGVMDGAMVKAIVVVRKIDQSGSCCLRITDILGDISNIGTLSSELQALLERERAEFIDCYNFGVNASVFEQIGFMACPANVVIPNYFEPFERKSVEIRFAYKNNTDKPYVIYKGDSDQDRPTFYERH